MHKVPKRFSVFGTPYKIRLLLHIDIIIDIKMSEYYMKIFLKCHVIDFSTKKKEKKRKIM